MLDRILAAAGDRRHNAPPEFRFKLYTAGPKRRAVANRKHRMTDRSWMCLLGERTQT
jgi:hypothetical protein